MSTLLKPAVLGVTLQNQAFSSFFPSDISAKVLLYSKNKKSTLPPISKIAVVININFVYGLNFLYLNLTLFISCQTIKPSPPNTIKSDIVIRITGSPFTVVSDDDGENIPIKSKPALQKAEMLVKSDIYTPRLNPASGIKRVESNAAPASSHEKVKIITDEKSRLTSPRLSEPTLSFKSIFCLRLIFCFVIRTASDKSVINPSPPI